MMMLKERIISFLIALYPSAWTRQYGVELRDTLLRRSLTPGAVLDLFSSALTEHWHTGEPWFLVGVFCLVLNLVTSGFYIAFGIAQSFESSPAAVFSLLILLGVGMTTVLHPQTDKVRPAWSAARTAMLSSLPTALLSILMLVHLLPVIPSDQAYVPGRHFAFVLLDVYKGPKQPAVPVLPLVLLAMLIVNLPVAALAGSVGGLLGRGVQSISRRRSART